MTDLCLKDGDGWWVENSIQRPFFFYPPPPRVKDTDRLEKCPAVFTIIISRNDSTILLLLSTFHWPPFSPPSGGFPDPAPSRGTEAAPTRQRPRGLQSRRTPPHIPGPRRPCPSQAPRASLTPAAAGAAPPPGRALPVTLRTLGVWFSRRPQAPDGEPKGPPSGKERKQTWEADESQAHPSLRGSARVAGARSLSMRFKGQQGQLASRALSAWLGISRRQLLFQEAYLWQERKIPKEGSYQRRVFEV